MKSILAPGAQALVAAFFGALVFTSATARAANALPAWNEGPARKSIIEFVAKVTKPGSPDFVPVAERIAAFDNDGTLWAEQPMYFQAFFIFDRLKALAPQHPERKDKEPFTSVLKGDLKSALAGASTRSSKWPWPLRTIFQLGQKNESGQL
jgi:hypothetical protein